MGWGAVDMWIRVCMCVLSPLQRVFLISDTHGSVDCDPITP